MPEYQLPNNWSWKKLSDIAVFISGIGYDKNDVCEEGLRVFRGGNIQDGRLITRKDDVFLPVSYDNDQNRILVGDTCIAASTGSVELLGKAATCFEDLGNTHIGAFLRIIRPKRKEHALFISALLQTDYYSSYIQKKCKGTSINNVRTDMLADFTFPFPPEDELLMLSDVYSVITKKILLNQQKNDTLQAMAHQLYDYWFVQFDFPNDDGHPYKASGGVLVKDPKFNKEIPEKWTIKRLSEICETRLGGTPDTSNNEYWNGPYNWLNSGEVAVFPIVQSEKTITEKGFKNSATSFLPYGSVTLSITRHLRPSIMAIDACINQSVVGILENSEIKKEYMYPTLLNDIPRLMALRTGAQQPHINKDIVDNIPIIVPSRKILELYYSLSKPLYSEIINNAKETLSLQQQRSFLLPMLLNGQVSVNQ